MINDIKKDANDRMDKSIAALVGELAKIRTGRAHPSLLEHITVDYYGSQVPLNQAANINAEDARTLSVVPFDKSMVATIEKAIMTSDLGLNPASAGTVIRVPMPPLTEERRRELVKVVHADPQKYTAVLFTGSGTIIFYSLLAPGADEFHPDILVIKAGQETVIGGVSGQLPAADCDVDHEEHSLGQLKARF